MSAWSLRRLWALWRTTAWAEVRHHPARHGVAVLAVMLGVGLALSVHWINASALAEFSSAVRTANGEPDAQLRHATDRLDDRWWAMAQSHPSVLSASPVLEAQAMAWTADGQRQPVRLWGVDALTVASVQPGLMPRLADGAHRLDLFAADAVFLNPAAQALMAGAPTDIQIGLDRVALRRAGTVSQVGSPLWVMDVGALQHLLGQHEHITRLDLRLRPGTDAQSLLEDWRRQAARDPALQAQALRLVLPDDGRARLSQASRAYRVNLTVLALVALFTGSFLVFSVLSLSVTQRLPAMALLGVLGLDARDRQRLVWLESALVGAVGSLLGVLLGTALAWAALHWLSGDLGGGYFDGVSPRLQWQATDVAVHMALGIGAAVLGGWWPARWVRGMAPAQALKGIPLRGADPAGSQGLERWAGPALMLAGGLLCLLPPLGGLPLGAYLGIAAGLLGGILTLPLLIGGGLTFAARRLSSRPLALLAVERARRFPGAAAVATSGMVASLALSVALTVMVGSFRLSMTEWLDAVLPADLYVRAAPGAQQVARLTPEFVDSVRSMPEVAAVEPQRQRSLSLDPRQPPVVLLARPLRSTRGSNSPVALPLVEPPLPRSVPEGTITLYVSEAVAERYGARPGHFMALPGIGPPNTRFMVQGVWRDYGRQHGSIAMDREDYIRLTGDASINDLAITLKPGASADALRMQWRQGLGDALELTSSQAIRRLSLDIFDRSFAITVWLQGVAIGMGMLGVSASMGAQVLTRRREFGLLRHLGLSRRQLLALVASEGAVWSVLGAVAGIVLGLCVSLVLVHVVNPQSFHWTMDLHVPWLRVGTLGAAVVAVGTLTAWASGRRAASPQAVQVVKQEA
jgi:putative ABC transport system permease protein